MHQKRFLAKFVGGHWSRYST